MKAEYTRMPQSIPYVVRYPTHLLEAGVNLRMESGLSRSRFSRNNCHLHPSHFCDRRGLQKIKLFEKVPSKIWAQEWVVHCKPVGDGQAALKYLAPYIQRVAISNRRLLSFENRGSLETSQSHLSVSRFRYRSTQKVHPFCRAVLSTFPATCPPACFCQGPLLWFLWRCPSSQVGCLATSPGQAWAGSD